MESHLLHWALVHSHKQHLRVHISSRDSLLSHGASNVSSTSLPLTTSTEEPVDWYLKFWSVYVMPVIIVLGVLNNVLILAVMPRAVVSVPIRIKRFYNAVALGDLLVVRSESTCWFLDIILLYCSS